MERVFRWNEWNASHIAEHGVWPEEAEAVVNAQHRPWPEYIGDGKRRVWGQTAEGRYLQVIYVYDPPGVVFVIHARDLNSKEKSQWRRRRHIRR